MISPNFAAFALASVAAGAPQTSAQTFIEAPAGDWMLPGHPRVVFPDTIDAYRRSGVIRYGEDDYSVTYRRRGQGAEDALVTFYVYRARIACEDEYAGNKAALAARFVDTRQVRETAPEAAGIGTARSVRFAGSIPSDVVSGEGTTDLYLQCDPATRRAIKYRATTNVAAWIEDAPALLATLQLAQRVER